MAVSAKDANTSSSATARATASTSADEFGHALPYAQKQFVLQFNGFFVRARYNGLMLFQFRRDIALTRGDRLLADIGGGHFAQVGFRDFDVVAEHGVVTDFQAR